MHAGALSGHVLGRPRLGYGRIEVLVRPQLKLILLVLHPVQLDVAFFLPRWRPPRHTLTLLHRQGCERKGPNLQGLLLLVQKGRLELLLLVDQSLHL